MNKALRKYLPSIVYGGSDGAVSYFALMAGAFGAGLPLRFIIAIGISNIIADAFSMASADYLSEESKTHENKNDSFKTAMITFISFVSIGFMPLIPSLYAYIVYKDMIMMPWSIFLISILLTFFSFILIGFIRGTILATNKYRMITQSVIVCSISAFVAYFVGEYIASLLTR